MHPQQGDLECQHLLYASPPNIEDCYRHRRANIIFKNLATAVAESSEVLMYNHCECCGRIVGKEPVLRFRYDPIQASYLGPGIPLFFSFFRSVLYVLTIYLLLFGLYSTVSNLQGTNCQQNCGTQTFWNKLSIFNIFNSYPVIQIQTYFQLLIIVLTILVNLSIRSYMNYLEIYIDQFFAKPSDYSVIVRGIDGDADRGDLEAMVGRRAQGLAHDDRDETEDLKIVDVLMVRELREFLEVERENLIKIKKHIKKKQTNPSLPNIYFQNPIIPQKFARTAIIIFSSAKSKSHFLGYTNPFQKFVRTLWGSYYPKSNVHQVKGKFVSVYRAPQPDDLIWENCGKDWTQLLGRRVALYLLSFVVLGIGGGIQYLLEFVRNKYVALEDTVIQYLFSLGAALIVTIFNFVLSQILEFMAFHEGHDTKTQLKVALTFRIVLFQFLNSGIFVVLSNIFVKITTDDRSYDFRKTVLSSNIVQLMFVNAVMGNAVNFIMNRYEVVKLYPRRTILKGQKLYPQIQANRIFQAPDIDMHLKYAYIFKTFWLTVFFMPTVPPVIIISALGLLVNYWTEKYLFSGAYTAPEAISSYLSNHVLNLLDYTPLWLTLGSLFMHIVRKEFVFGDIESEIKNLHYLFLMLSIANIFLPYYAILKRFNRYRDPPTNESTYEQSVCTFELTYEDTNPMYANHRKKRVRDQQIFKQKLVQDVEFKEMRMRISQSQVLISHKESIMNKSSVLTGGEYEGFTRNRASSLNF